MMLPPTTAVETSTDHIALDLDIHGGLDAFHDHFPDHHILPGVVQIDWVMRLAAQHLGLSPLAKNFQVKFRSIIHPNTTVRLVLQHDRERRRLSFTYKNGDDILSSGTVKLDA